MCLCGSRALEIPHLLNSKAEDPESCEKSSTGNAEY